MFETSSEMSQGEPQTAAAELFFDRAFARVVKFMLIAFLLAAGPVAWRFGWRSTLGFAAGCLVAFINLHWLERTVSSLADFVLRAPHKSPAARVVSRFLLRYFLMAFGAYAIFRVSLPAFYGLLAGLFLPLAGIFCEAIYEFCFALHVNPK